MLRQPRLIFILRAVPVYFEGSSPSTAPKFYIMIRPHATDFSAFGGGELRKSFMTHGINKGTRTYGGSSGYTSEARDLSNKTTNLKVVGKVDPARVVKTIIHRCGKILTRAGYVPMNDAFSLSFVSRLEYVGIDGKTMSILNTNIR